MKEVLSDTTRIQYEGRLRSIAKFYNITDKQYDRIVSLNTIEQLYPNLQSRKGALSALLWWCNCNKDKQLRNNFKEEVQLRFDELKKTCKEQAKKQELTPHQLTNYMDKTALLTLYNTATSKLDWTSTTYTDEWIYYTIVCLYTIQPPVRADYWDMDIHDCFWKQQDPIADTIGKFDPTWNHLELQSYIKQLDNTKNHLVHTPYKSVFVFNIYKTAEAYGSRVIELEYTLHHLIKHLIKQFKLEKLLPIDTPNALVKAVKKAFSHFGGKEITIGLLRHAHITEFYKSNPSIKSKEDMAYKMLHSRNIQEEYSSHNVQDDDI